MNIFKMFVRERKVGSLIVGIFIFGIFFFMGCNIVVMFNLLNFYIILMKIVCLIIKIFFVDYFFC